MIIMHLPTDHRRSTMRLLSQRRFGPMMAHRSGSRGHGLLFLLRDAGSACSCACGCIARGAGGVDWLGGCGWSVAAAESGDEACVWAGGGGGGVGFV